MKYQARTCFASAVGEGETPKQAIEAMLKGMIKPSYTFCDIWTVQILEGEGPLSSLKSDLIKIQVSVNLGSEGLKTSWSYQK